MSVLIVVQNPQAGAIEGVVTDRDGDPLPGVQVQATTEGYSILDFTGPDGSYRFTEVPLGVFAVRAELPGFCQPSPAQARVEAGRPARVDISLELGGLEIVDKVIFPLAELVEMVDAVVHVRIVRSHPPRLRVPNITCGSNNVLTDHEAEVIAEVKVGAGLRLQSRRFMLVQRRAGVFAEGGESVEGSETPWVLGDEFIAFLYWSEDDEYLGPHWSPSWMVPLRDGAVAWEGPVRIQEVREGMPLEALLGRLREEREPSSLR